MPKVYKPEEVLHFWCDECDKNVVVSTECSTGRFFIQHGHRDLGEGEYCSVVFAICSDCLDREGVK